MLRDARYAIRLLLRRPVFAVSAILTLAFCIGANTAIYTVVDRLLLRPLPYPEPDRLVEVVTQFWRGDIGFGQTGGTWEVLRHGVAALDLATTSGGFGSTGVNLVVGDQDRKSTRLNSSHSQISYAVFCLKKKKRSRTN